VHHFGSAACTIAAGGQAPQQVAAAIPAAPPFTGENAGTKLQIAEASNKPLDWLC
jgi:hypothetical protein